MAQQLIKIICIKKSSNWLNLMFIFVKFWQIFLNTKCIFYYPLEELLMGFLYPNQKIYEKVKMRLGF